jgi:hypothetical protein
MGGTCSTHERDDKVYKTLVAIPEGKKPFRRFRCGWEDNIKMDLGKIGREGIDWTHLAHNMGQWQAVVNTVIKVRVS